MRILWLSKTPGLYPFPANGSGYNGGGWISSLQQLLEGDEDVDLAIAFISSSNLQYKTIDNFSYYPIQKTPESIFNKFKKYYTRKNLLNEREYVNDVSEIISHFRPDVIHIFGFENDMANIIGSTNIPIVIHLQGLMCACANAYWPIDVNDKSFTWPITIRETFIRNGYSYEKAYIEARAEREKKLFSRISNVMGRTSWDRAISNIYSPNAIYYHVNEVLRPEFYINAGIWKYTSTSPIKIVSTISDVTYKGLDVILKTANLLTNYLGLSIEWDVVGVSKNTRIVKFFERKLKVSGEAIGVKYCGIYTPSELTSLLASSCVYVHPSYIDNSPNSVCEAQMLGVPVIASNVGGVCSLVEHGVTGLLAPANDPYSFASYIKQIHEDKSLAETISSNSVEVSLKRHNKEDILQSLKEAYRTIANKEMTV